MKITDVKTTLLSVPHLEPEFVSTGIRKGVTQALIEIETDEGIVGLGESVCRPNARVIEGPIEPVKFCASWTFGASAPASPRPNWSSTRS